MSSDPLDGRGPDVSVVIPTLNAEATLREQLEALSRQRTPRSFEVLVADNGSTDGTRAVVLDMVDHLPGLRIVDASRRTGSNVARNCGARSARAEFVLLCDSDDVVADGWLEIMAGALESADGVGGTLELHRLNPRHAAAKQAESMSGIRSPLDFLPRPTGANAGFRRSVWAELGGFNEDYVRGGTETEFFWRMQLAGHTFREVPEAVVSYRLRGDIRRSMRQMYVWGRQHAMLYRDFRADGLSFRAIDTLGAYWSVLRQAATLPWHHGGKWPLVMLLAYRGGRVAGSYRYRVVFP